MFKKNLKKVITIALVASMMVGAAAGCGNNQTTDPTPTPTTAATPGTEDPGKTPEGPTPTPELVVETFEGDYVFKDSVSVISAYLNFIKLQ